MTQTSMYSIKCIALVLIIFFSFISFFGEVFVGFLLCLFQLLVCQNLSFERWFWYIFSYENIGMQKIAKDFHSMSHLALDMSHFSLTNDGVCTWATSWTKMSKRGRNGSRNRFHERGKDGENKQLLAPSQLVHSVATWKGSSIWSEDYS